MEENVPLVESRITRWRKVLPALVVIAGSVGIVLFAILTHDGKTDSAEVHNIASINVVTRIAEWKGNKKGAFTLSFDDSMVSQADVAVPAMLERGLVGTWFINPGKEHYQQRQQVWEQILPSAGHELANHTMHHEGAKDLDEAEFEIGETARIIWSLRPAGANKLLSFQRGGATDWDLTEEEWNFLDQKYHLVHRTDSRSMADANASEMISHAQEALEQGTWVRIHFHGIGGEWLPVEPQDFLQLLDYMVSMKEDLWIDSYGSVYKYIQERDTTQVSVLEASNQRIRLNLNTDVPLELFDEPLTLITEVPPHWTSCKVNQAGQTNVYEVKDGFVQYEAVPGLGEITLTQDS
jgi:hypothetical protein